MNIGFYGQSNCAYRGQSSYIDMVASNLSAKVVNTGVRQGSEERILWELKKTKAVDFAVIFHSVPSYLFIPGSDRDFDLKGILNRKADYVWKTFEIQQMSNNWDYHVEHHRKFVDKFNTTDNFVDVVSKYKDYLYDPDLAMNRYTGSLIQIDQYLMSKQIKCLHIVQSTLPSWFTFSSGPVDTNILEFFKNYKADTSTDYINGISTEGNKLLAEYLTNIIAARSREVLH